jgi:hypothetical protein
MDVLQDIGVGRKNLDRKTANEGRVKTNIRTNINNWEIQWQHEHEDRNRAKRVAQCSGDEKL